MNILMHFPQSKADLDTLPARISEIHAEAAIHHLDQLTCPREQKLELLIAILQAN